MNIVYDTDPIPISLRLFLSLTFYQLQTFIKRPQLTYYIYIWQSSLFILFLSYIKFILSTSYRIYPCKHVLLLGYTNINLCMTTRFLMLNKAQVFKNEIHTHLLFYRSQHPAWDTSHLCSHTYYWGYTNITIHIIFLFYILFFT